LGNDQAEVENVDYQPSALPELVRSGAFADDPFVLVDVGCSLGIDPVWRLFEPFLHAYAFDPQVEEIGRLQELERNPNVLYRAAFVGLTDNDAERPAGAVDNPSDPFQRSSAVAALAPVIAAGDASFSETSDWQHAELATEKLALDSFLRASEVPSVDFVKIDTDGSDFEVLRSIEPAIGELGVLGFMVEASYTSTNSEKGNAFTAIDRFMKRHGFLLADLSIYRYSRAVLPAPFTHRMLAQTVSGQPIWGDAVYLRDPADPARPGELSPTKLLKLACLCELFRLPDCAVELLLARRDALASLVDVDRLLDLLTPPLQGKRVSYREYVAAFEREPTAFYPGEPRLGQRVRRAAFELLGPESAAQVHARLSSLQRLLRAPSGWARSLGPARPSARE
jgi:FkbM family methyltransferase